MYTVKSIACHHVQLPTIPKLGLSLYCHTWSITSLSVDVEAAERRSSRIAPFHKVIIISQSLELPLHFSQPIWGLCDVKWLDQPPLSVLLLSGKQHNMPSLMKWETTVRGRGWRRLLSLKPLLPVWFIVYYTASCTFPIKFKALSVSSLLNLLTSDHERRQVTVALFMPAWVEVQAR